MDPAVLVRNDDRHLFTLRAHRDMRLVAPFDVAAAGNLHAIYLLDQLHQDVLGFAKTAPDIELKDSRTGRAPLIKALSSKGIDGWLLPIENSIYAVEVCIFAPLGVVEVLEGAHNARIHMTPGTAATCIATAKRRDLRKWAKTHAEEVEANGQAWTPLDHLHSAWQAKR
jgi:hypothetical protein